MNYPLGLCSLWAKQLPPGKDNSLDKRGGCELLLGSTQQLENEYPNQVKGIYVRH